MTENSAGSAFARQKSRSWRRPRVMDAVWGVLGVVVLACVLVLEMRFAGLDREEIVVGQTPVSILKPQGGDPAPPVIVAHGFAGSRQMMDQLAVSVARQGFVVASVDLPGHGRNPTALSPDITRIEGTTAQLVEVIAAVAEAVVLRPDTTGPVSFVGHSMATDVVIRAAGSRADVGAVVAISMYSPAVTESHPQALLVLSGATEGHLREAGLDAVSLVSPDAGEGETVRQGDVVRRTAVAPWVGHVGVLYAPASLDEATGWLRDVTGAGRVAALDYTGWVSGVLLVGLVLLAWPISRTLPKRQVASQLISGRVFLACLLAPIPVALGIAALPVFGIAGFAAFGTLGAVLAGWGIVQGVILWRAGVRVGLPDWQGALCYLGLSLAFALALDRYGAAFVPAGERLIVLTALLIGTVPAMVADTVLTYQANWLRRLLARVAVLLTLSIAMAFQPTTLGLAFTVIPVMVLYFVVYGTIARWVAARRGPDGVAVGKAVVLAWAIAASTPLFAA